MPNRQPVALLRETQAQRFIDDIADPKTKRIVEFAYEPVLRRFGNAERLPFAHFDALFFVEGLFRSLSCHTRVAAVLGHSKMDSVTSRSALVQKYLPALRLFPENRETGM